MRSKIARRVMACRGQRGSNIEYVLNTVSHLRALGVRDAHLAAVVRAVHALDAKSAGSKTQASTRAQASVAAER